MVALVLLVLVRPQCRRCWHASLICWIDRVFWCYQSILLVCRYKLSVFCWLIVFFMFGKPSASNFSGNILRNVETGRAFPCAPVSIFRRNLWMPFWFGNWMIISTKTSSLWVILIQLNVRLSIYSSASLLLYTASVFTNCFLLYCGW